MKKKNKIKIITIIMLLLLTTGCTKQLTDENNKAVKKKAVKNGSFLQPSFRLSGKYSVFIFFKGFSGILI